MQIRSFLEKLRINKSKRTIETYAYILRAFKTYSKISDDSEPTRDDVEDYINSLIKAERKPAGIQTSYYAIRSYFNFLGYANELKTIELPVVRQDMPKMASLEDIKKLKSFKYIRRDTALMITFMYGMGLRVSEVLKLRVDDFIERDEQGETVYYLRVHSSKVRSGPYVDLMPIEEKVIIDEIKNYITGIAPERYMFTDNGIKALAPNTVRSRLKKLCKSIGIDYLNPHSFRHARATQLARQGVPKELIRAYLRQDSDKAVDRYIHLTGKDLRGKTPDAFGDKNGNK